jgi:hypothetical protein
MFTRDCVYCIVCVIFSISCKVSSVACNLCYLRNFDWASCLTYSCYYICCDSGHYSLSSFYLSETGFCLRLQVDPTQLGPIDRASLYLNLNKNRMLDNVQKHNSYINIPSSQTFRSYSCCVFSQTVCHNMILMFVMKTVIIL